MDQIRQSWDWMVQRWQVEEVILTAENDLRWLIILIALGVFLATLNNEIWLKVRHIGTLWHEMGHVSAAKITGRSVSGIKLHDDSSGVTISRGDPKSIGSLITVLAGYPAPGAVAMLLAWFASIGMTGAALSIYNIMLIFALLLCRNVFGFIVCISAIIGTGVISVWNDPHAVSIAVIALVIICSVSGIRGSIELVKVHGSRWNGGIPKDRRIAEKENAKTSDASQAFRMTLIPTWVWIAVFLVFNVFASVFSMFLLLS